ncbi:MAG: four helix bundle protein [Armatimonadota bacterium]
MAENIKSYRDLRVWQSGIDLVELIYKVTSDFPKSETYGLASQMQRAAVSVPSNIAEGQAREHLKEYLHHNQWLRVPLPNSILRQR